MDDRETIKQYELQPRKKYRAFTDNSLIQLWPALHRNPIVWIALVVNAGAAVLSLYASSLLDQRSEEFNFAVVILLVSTFAQLSVFVSQSIEQWIHVTEENNIRKLLLTKNIQNPSLANIDLPNAVYTISFYVAFPAHIVSLVLYAGYVLINSPGSMIIVILVALAFAYPVYRFALWRSGMIRVVRAYRNRLVDDFGSRDVDHDVAVDNYARAGIEFYWRNIQAIYLLRIVVFAVLFTAITLNETDGNTFSVLVAMMLLLSEGQKLFVEVCEFQEDKVSLARIKQAIS